MAHTPIRVLCVDDHVIVIKGLMAMLEHEPDISIVGYATSGQDALDQYVRHTPDVALMDLQLPGMSGLEAIAAIRRHDPAAKILVLTMYHGVEDIYRAMHAGASGYLLKDSLADNLAHAIREVHAGRTAVAEEVAANLASREADGALSPREIQVIQAVAHGMRNKEIASELGISEDTVNAHIKSIFLKLHVHDRTAALSVALRRGIIHLD
jgi:DNA-binding NarL/FixJ family response regulator